MKRISLISAIAIVLISFVPELVMASEELKVKSDILGSLKFGAPEKLADKKYMGLSDGPNFNLKQVKTKFLIIEIFSMYCPICQRDAGAVNQLYDMIQKTPDLRDNVRIVGIGAGNTPYEVDVFRNKFNVLFPLIADDNFSIQKALSHDIRTPTFLISRLSNDGSLEMVLTKVGEIKDAGEFLKTLMTTFNSK